MHADTLTALNFFLAGCGSQKAAAPLLGVSQPVISDMLHRPERVSIETENKVRRVLALPPVPAQVLVDACPDCGSVHVVGRCKGRTGAPKIVSPRRQPTRWRDYPVSQLAKAIRERIEL